MIILPALHGPQESLSVLIFLKTLLLYCPLICIISDPKLPNYGIIYLCLLLYMVSFSLWLLLRFSFFSIFKLFYCCSITVVSIFMTPLFPPASTQTPTLNPTPIWLCPWILYTCSLMSLSLLCPIISLPVPSGYSLFLISMSLVIFWLLVCFFD